MVVFTELQEKAFKLMVDGKNIFVTGQGGVGKSEVIRQFTELYGTARRIAITSTTGTSAVLINGSTVYSYLGIQLGRGSVDYLYSVIKKNYKALKRWKSTEVLIIDEISMFPPELFDKLNALGKIIRRSVLPFGGIQLILSGDFLQLPCIGTDSFCFEATSWGECVDHTIYMTDIVRQQNVEFQQCLANVRVANLTNDVIQLLNSRVGVELTNDNGIKPTLLFSHNSTVDFINDNELDKLAEKGAEFVEYTMQVSGLSNYRDKIQKNCNAPAVLQLCVGAQVMLLVNIDVEGGLCNGSRGVVISFIENKPVVRFVSGIEMIVDYHKYTYDEEGIQKAKIKQIPLRIAYALSIHKIQGATLDYAIMDLSKIFGYAQAYTALSRVRNIENLSIVSIDYDMILAHPKAVEYYRNLC